VSSQGLLKILENKVKIYVDIKFITCVKFYVMKAIVFFMFILT